jgi:hypothetical protein
LNTFDKVPHQLLEPIIAEDLMESVVRTLLIILQRDSYPQFVPEVPTGDDILMDLYKEIVQCYVKVPNTIEKTSII